MHYMNKEAKMHCLGRIMTGLLGIVAFVLAAVIGQYSGWYKTPGWSWPILVLE